MPENATVMDSLESDETTLKEKLVNLARQLEEAERLKKSAMKKFNDDIKDIKEEMKMTLVLLKQAEEADGNP